MPIKRAIVIGGGITGVAAAIALIKHNGISCSVFEIRSAPATIGGAIGLTPKALRYLDYLGVLPRLKSKGCEVKRIEVMSHRTGKRLGTIDYDHLERFGHCGLRIKRHLLLDAMLETLQELGVRVQYGKEIISVAEKHDYITANFEDGTEVEGDILLGCDGIHSAIRTKFIQPDRKPEYTGIASAYGYVETDGACDSLPIDPTRLYSGRFGSLLLSYANAKKSLIYYAAVMRSVDVGSREGWLAKGHDRTALKDDLLRRFASSRVPFIATALERIDEITLYPVYKLSDNGKWYSGRMLLLGDAAHAMPPQGESAGLALEDAILLSRILDHHEDRLVRDLFQTYDAIRRPPITAAVKEANFGFETIQDRGWLTMVIIEWLTWVVLLWRATRKQEEMASDVREISLCL